MKLKFWAVFTTLKILEVGAALLVGVIAFLVWESSWREVIKIVLIVLYLAFISVAGCVSIYVIGKKVIEINLDWTTTIMEKFKK